MNEVKNAGNRVCNSARWNVFNVGVESEMEALQAIHNVSLGTQHKPIQHFDAMMLFRGEVEKRGYVFGSENMMVSPNNLRSVYTIDIADANIPDLGFTLGLSNWNDKKRSATVLGGDKVFLCSNQSFRSLINQKQRHVKSADVGLVTKINMGIDQFDVFRTNRLVEIDRMKNAILGDRELSMIALSMLRSSEFYPQIVGEIVNQFDKPSYDYQDTDPRSAWAMFNAETHIAKSINPVKRISMDAAMTEIINKVIAA